MPSQRAFPRATRLLALCGAASFAIYGGPSCASHGHGSAPSAELADVIFEGAATPDALEAMLALDPVKDAPKYAVLDAPSDGATFSASEIPTFSWHLKDATAAGALAPAPPPARRWAFDLAPGDRGDTNRGADWLAGLLGPERSAQAHRAPVNGPGYFLLLSTENDENAVRVFTTNTSYTPDAATWAKATSGGALVSAWVLTGIFMIDEIAPGGGPFKGPWIGVQVMP